MVSSASAINVSIEVVVEMCVSCFARKLIDLLRKKGTHVYLVSGGFRSVIEPVMDYLNIPRDNLYANRIIFDSKGV